MALINIGMTKKFAWLILQLLIVQLFVAANLHIVYGEPILAEGWDDGTFDAWNTWDESDGHHIVVNPDSEGDYVAKFNGTNLPNDHLIEPPTVHKQNLDLSLDTIYNMSAWARFDRYSTNQTDHPFFGNGYCAAISIGKFGLPYSFDTWGVGLVNRSGVIEITGHYYSYGGEYQRMVNTTFGWDTWYFLSMIFYTNETDGWISFYKDGVSFGSITGENTWTVVSDFRGSANIGFYQQYGLGFHSNATFYIDDVRLEMTVAEPPEPEPPEPEPPEPPDTKPPEISIAVTPDALWPPNHKYVDVKTVVTVSDAEDPSPILSLVSVTSNEPDNGKGDGNTVDDIVIIDDFTFKLRVERSGKNKDRIYTIVYEATDASGNSAQAYVTVSVHHNK